MKKLLAGAALALLLTGCATTSPITPAQIAEMRAGAKSVAFIQNGTEPHQYLVGAVDGKTSWAGPQVAFTPATSSRMDTGAAAAANLVSAIGSSIAREAMKDDPHYYDRLLKKMVGERQFTSEITPGVLPALAKAWQVEYDATKLRIVPNSQLVTDDKGLFTGEDPGADLVLMFSVPRFMLSEKPQMSVLWKAVVTAGTYDRPVVPYISGLMSVYRRDEAGQLKVVWSARCNDIDFLNAPVSEEFAVLKEAPEKAGPVFDAAIPIAVESCRKALKPIS